MEMFLPPADVTMSNWNILHFKANDTVQEWFVGYSQGDRLGRLSTDILEFDLVKGAGKTESGSNYKMLGEPGMPHGDALYVLERQIGRKTVYEILKGEHKQAKFKYSINEKDINDYLEKSSFVRRFQR